MDGDKFIELALVTESNDFKAISRRLENKDLLLHLSDVIEEVVVATEKLDQLKGYIFYGKDVGIPIDRDKDFKETFLYSIKSKLNDDQIVRLLHGIMGMTTESGNELLGMFNDYLFKEKDLDLFNVEEELGDSNWFQSVIIDVVRVISNPRVSWNTIWDKCISKLRKRFSGKFSEHEALSRNLSEERKVLEK